MSVVAALRLVLAAGWWFMQGLRGLISVVGQTAWLGPVVAPALMLAVALVCGQAGVAQNGAGNPSSGAVTPQASPSKTQAPAATARQKKRLHPSKQVADPTPAATVHPPEPPAPSWPVNAKAEPAAVDWNGRDLSINATNSSLQQILRDVSTATGVKVDGVNSGPNDQRVYGTYGPAPARDVLATLLNGSGYNVLMVGDQGEGTPRELVLTAKAHGAAGQQRGQANADDESQDEPDATDPNDPLQRRGGLNGLQPGQNRTPQQMIQELQLRRQQQEQQQQQQQPPPAAAPQNNN